MAPSFIPSNVPFFLPRHFAFGTGSAAVEFEKNNPRPKSGLDTFTEVALGLGVIGFAVGFPMLVRYIWRSPQAPSTQEPQGTQPPQVAQPTSQTPQPPTQVARASKPGFKEFESQGDVELGRGETAVAMHSYSEALGDLFIKINAQRQEWKAALAVSIQKATQALSVVIDGVEWKWESTPYAADVVRLRQKLVGIIRTSVTDGMTDIEQPLAWAIKLLGPDLGKTTVAELLKLADTPARIKTLADGLDEARYLSVHVPDDGSDDNDPLSGVRFQAQCQRAVMLEIGLFEKEKTHEAFAEVADAYDRASVDAPAGDDLGYIVQKGVRYYALAAVAALREGLSPEDYFWALHEVMRLHDAFESGVVSGGGVDFVSLALRAASTDDAPEEWAKVAQDLLDQTPKEDHRWTARAFDAATQWFKNDNARTAADVLGRIVGEGPVQTAFGNTLCSGLFAFSPVEAALAAFGAELKIDHKWSNTPADASFDLLQRHLVALVDAAIRSAVAVPAGTSPLTLTDRLGPDVELAAALTEIMRSKGNAPLAMDQVVMALKVGPFKYEDVAFAELRKALRGEPVSESLAAALREAIPLPLRPEWKDYAEARAAEYIEAKGRAEDRDRDAERDPRWKPDMVPVGAPPIL